MIKKSRHIFRKVVLGLLAALLLVIGIFLLIDYGHYRKDPSPYRIFIVPRLELSLFQVNYLSADRADMMGRMLIHNPLPFNLRADSLQYQIFIEGVEVIKSTYPKSLDIKKWDSTWIDLPVTTYTDKLTTVLKNAEKEGRDSVVYEVNTSFGTNIIFHKDFNLKIQKLLPLIYIPEIKMDKIEYDSLNAEGITLFLNTLIVNKNKFPLQFKDLDFKFALADNDWVHGKKPGIINIADTSTTLLVLPLRISFKEIGKSLGPLIKHGKNTGFKLNMNLKLVSDNNALKNSVVLLNDAGTIHEIVQLAKDEKKKSKEAAAKNPEEQPKKKKIKFEKRHH